MREAVQKPYIHIANKQPSNITRYGVYSNCTNLKFEHAGEIMFFSLDAAHSFTMPHIFRLCLAHHHYINEKKKKKWNEKNGEALLLSLEIILYRAHWLAHDLFFHYQFLSCCPGQIQHFGKINFSKNEIQLWNSTCCHIVLDFSLLFYSNPKIGSYTCMFVWDVPNKWL